MKGLHHKQPKLNCKPYQPNRSMRFLTLFQNTVFSCEKFCSVSCDCEMSSSLVLVCMAMVYGDCDREEAIESAPDDDIGGVSDGK